MTGNRKISWDPLLQAAVFLATGFAITFSQEHHENFGFNKVIFTGFLLLMVALFLKNFKTKLPHLLGSIAAAVAVLFVSDTNTLWLVMLIWAAVFAVLNLVQWLKTKDRGELTVTIMLAALALILLLLARSLPAVMGFFGAFCIIAGVYLGISAFDPPQKGLKANENGDLLV